MKHCHLVSKCRKAENLGAQCFTSDDRDSFKIVSPLMDRLPKATHSYNNQWFYSSVKAARNSTRGSRKMLIFQVGAYTVR